MDLGAGSWAAFEGEPRWYPWIVGWIWVLEVGQLLGGSLGDICGSWDAFGCLK